MPIVIVAVSPRPRATTSRRARSGRGTSGRNAAAFRNRLGERGNGQADAGPKSHAKRGPSTKRTKRKNPVGGTFRLEAKRFASSVAIRSVLRDRDPARDSGFATAPTGSGCRTDGAFQQPAVDGSLSPSQRSNRSDRVRVDVVVPVFRVRLDMGHDIR
ncbi:MAG TPA: hypothetical protein DCQ98_13725 [Planctomycetaceae bacterium]|nr:hypothetical protein [Planctomycetaceae bacterium]